MVIYTAGTRKGFGFNSNFCRNAKHYSYKSKSCHFPSTL